jgi:hypothetical protein
MNKNIGKLVIIFNLPTINDNAVARDIYNMLLQNNTTPKAIKVVAKEIQASCSTPFIYFHNQNEDEIVLAKISKKYPSRDPKRQTTILAAPS